MRIQEDGNVGIGSASPEARLNVLGSAGTPGDGIRITRSGLETQYLHIDSDSINKQAGGGISLQSDSDGNIYYGYGRWQRRHRDCESKRKIRCGWRW